MEVTLASPTVGVGGSVQLAARLTDAFNNELTGRVVTWSSSDPLVASVDQSSGLVTGLVPGTATVTATSEGKRLGPGYRDAGLPGQREHPSGPVSLLSIEG